MQIQEPALGTGRPTGSEFKGWIHLQRPWTGQWCVTWREQSRRDGIESCAERYFQRSWWSLIVPVHEFAGRFIMQFVTFNSPNFYQKPLCQNATPHCSIHLKPVLFAPLTLSKIENFIQCWKDYESSRHWNTENKFSAHISRQRFYRVPGRLIRHIAKRHEKFVHMPRWGQRHSKMLPAQTYLYECA